MLQFRFVTGLKIYEPIKWERRKNLQGVHLVNVVMEEARYIWVKECSNLTKSCDVAGFGYDVLKFLSKSLKFTFETRVPTDLNWGYREENETNFNGIVGMLQR